MDRIVSSFPLARLASTHYGGERNKAESDDTVTAALQQRCEELTRSHQCHTSVCAADKFDGKRRVLDTHGDYNITITGKPSAVKAARGELLRNNPLKVKLSVKATRLELFGPGGELKEILKPTIDKIVADTKATISIAVNNQDRPISGFHSDNYAEINITGSALAAEAARVRVLVLLDELLGLRAEIITTIDSKLHNLICGRKRCYLQSIMEETATNIYFQSPFNHVTSDAVHEGEPAALADDSHAEVEPVYITGDSTGIQRAKEMLIKLSNQKAQSLFHKDAVVGARKLDWMLLYRRDELKAVMHDNGSFIMFPPLGSGYDKVTVYAENRVNAERTLRSLYALACQLYEAFFVIQPKDGMLFGVSVVKFYSAYPQIAHLVANISQSSGAEATFKSELCIEVFGTERAVRNAYQTINEMSFMKLNHRETIFSVELSVEQREFISGKKNGKINKIMKTSGVKIKFTPHTEYNFLIEVSSNSFTKALDGLTLLQEELPAEISFYVPETYHKRIIGVGGKNIQRIMKKYGVYVKFSNAEEFAALGGYYDNEDNVVARTPAKNAINLDNLRHSVMELVAPKDKDFTSQPVTIPRRFHRCLLVQRGAYLHEVEEKTNCRFRWPDKETASEKITVHGPETQIHLATGLLLELIPEEYNYRAPFSSELAAVVDSADFNDLVTSRIKLECNITVITSAGSPPPPADCKSLQQSSATLEVDDHADNRRRSLNSSSGSSSSTAAMAVAACPETSLSAIQNVDQADHSESDYVFVFKFTRNNMDVLPSALEILVDYLKEHQVPLYTDNTPAIVRPRCDSFADAFPHFNSKLLSSVSQPNSESPTTSTFPSYNLFDNGASNAFEWKTFLDDTSSDTDIRSAFESKHGGFDTYRRDSGFDISAMSSEVGTAPYSESYSPSPKHSQVDIWGPQTKMMHLGGLHGSSSGLYSPQHASPVATPPAHPYDSSSQSGHQAQYHHTFPGAHRHHRHGASRGLNYDRPVGSTSTSSSTSSSGMSSHRSVPETLAHKELRAMQASRSAFAAASSSSSERRYSASQVSHSTTRPTRDDYFLHSSGGPMAGGAGAHKDYDHMVAFFEGMNIGYQPLIAGFYPEVAPSTQRINGRASGFDI